MSLLNRTLMLGVTGSIAAYKAVELVRALTTAGAGFACDTNLVVLLDPEREGSKNFRCFPSGRWRVASSTAWWASEHSAGDGERIED